MTKREEMHVPDGSLDSSQQSPGVAQQSPAPSFHFDSTQFEDEQLIELQNGIQSGVDISVYANPAYNWTQMEQIRLGLEADLDVSIYANPVYDWTQMEQIRCGLDEDLQVQIYADPRFNHNQMREIRNAMNSGVEVSMIADPKLEPHQMRQRIAQNIDMSKYVNSKSFVDTQLDEIREGLVDGLDVSVYAKPVYTSEQMFIIRKGLEFGLDVSKFASPKFNSMQMKVISTSLLTGVDVSSFAKPDIPWVAMGIMSYGVEHNVDVEKYLSEDFDKMRAIYYTLSMELDLEPYLHLSAPQLKVVIDVLEHSNNEQVKLLANPDLTVEQMTVLAKYIKADIDVSDFAKPEYDYVTMNILLSAKSEGIDLTEYLNDGVSSTDLDLIRRVIKLGYDVTKKDSSKTPVKRMEL